MRPPVTHDSVTERRSGNSELCLTCGLCCNGALHASVTVRAEHVLVVRNLGLTLEKSDGDEFEFRQPCPLYQNDRCSAYPHHPPTCQEYRCALLQKYEDDGVTLEKSLTIIRTAKELLVDGVGRLAVGPEFDLAQSWDAEHGVRGSGALREANAELLLRVVALEVHLKRHFRRPTKESDPAEGRPTSMVSDTET